MEAAKKEFSEEKEMTLAELLELNKGALARLQAPSPAPLILGSLERFGLSPTHGNMPARRMLPSAHYERCAQTLTRPWRLHRRQLRRSYLQRSARLQSGRWH